MIGRCAPLLALMFAGAAQAASLSEAGTDLGRVNASTLSAGLSVTVDLEDAQAQTAFLIARFQDNRPLMKASDGLWEPWDGDTATLADAGLRVSEGTITFPIVGEFAPEFSFPCVFTIGVVTEAGVRSAFIVVDGP